MVDKVRRQLQSKDDGTRTPTRLEEYMKLLISTGYLIGMICTSYDVHVSERANELGIVGKPTQSRGISRQVPRMRSARRKYGGEPKGGSMISARGTVRSLSEVFG